MQKVRRRTSNQALPWLMAFAVISWVPSMAALHSGTPYSVHSGTYTVGRGESLWSIAAHFVGRNGDVDSLVDRIVAINQLSKSPLHPGQQIRIPESVQVAE